MNHKVIFLSIVVIGFSFTFTATAEEVKSTGKAENINTEMGMVSPYTVFYQEEESAENVDTEMGKVSSDTVFYQEEPAQTGEAVIETTATQAASTNPETVAMSDTSNGNEFYQKYIQNHLEIGTRSTAYTFKDDKQGEPFQGSYLGSLNEIHEHQNYSPVKAFIQYMFTPYIGIGAAYDQFNAVTGSSPNGEAWGDGTFELQGAYLYLLGSFENETRYTPFVEFGFAFYDADFKEKESWYDNGRRVINAENTTGVGFAIGCDIEVYEQWSVDVYFRYMDVDVDVDYVFLQRIHTPGTFPLDHYSYGIGIKYSF